MNGMAKTIGLIVGVFIVGVLSGFFGATAMYQTELEEVRGNLQSATAESENLREKIEQSSERFIQLARIARERQETIERLEGTVQRLESSIREREKIIEEISSGLGGVQSDTAEIGKLAEQGRNIVRSILSEGD